MNRGRSPKVSNVKADNLLFYPQEVLYSQGILSSVIALLKFPLLLLDDEFRLVLFCEDLNHLHT